MATKSNPFNVRKRVSFNIPSLSSDEAGSENYIGPPRRQRLHPVSEEESEEPSPKRRRRMTEPRARAARHKGQLNFQTELKSALHAFGDQPPPLPETIRALDEIVTDFIIETCHSAARAAAVSRRQKIKVEDFNWAVRGDERMLGRVRELLVMEKELREARKQFSTEEGKVGLERGRKRKGEGVGEAEGV